MIWTLSIHCKYPGYISSFFFTVSISNNFFMINKNKKHFIQARVSSTDMIYKWYCTNFINSERIFQCYKKIIFMYFCIRFLYDLYCILL